MISKASLDLLKRRYLLRDDKGDVVETPEDMFRRVADFIGNSRKEKEEFYNIMSSLDFLPSSPFLFNAGTEYSNLFSCFVLPIQDSIESIFDTLTRAARIFQRGGGVGYDFSPLRPKGAIISTSKGASSGPVSFMKIFNTMTEVVKSGGKRKGAQIACLRVDHPDIEEFIKCKDKEGELNNFNISVGVTDEFMKKVEEDGYYELKHEKLDKPIRKKARYIFDMLSEQAWKNGEPGLLFLDTINRKHSLYDEITATNPCLTGDTLIAVADGRGAVPIKKLAREKKDVPVFTQDDNGDITIRKMRNIRCTRKNAKTVKITLDNGYYFKCTPDHKIRLKSGEYVKAKDLKKNDSLLHITRYKTNNRFQDHKELQESASLYNFKVISVEEDNIEDVYDGTVDDFHNFYIGHFPGKTHRSDRDKFSYVNVHNCSEAILRPYGSCDLGSINLTHMIKNEKIDWERLRNTIRIAVRFLDNAIDKNRYLFPEIEKVTKESRKIGLGVLGWADFLILLKLKYNSSQAIELAKKVAKFIYEEAEKQSVQLAKEKGPFPLFAKSKLKNKEPRRNASLLCIAPTGSISLIANTSSGIEPIFSTKYTHTDQDGNQTLIEKELYKNNPYVITANEISYEDHIKMQAAFQQHVDQGISKTINMDNSATVEDVKNAYKLAWKSGCKGITIYRNESRKKQVLNVVRDKKEKPEVSTDRPYILHGHTIKMKTGCGSLYVTLNYSESGKPIEVFARLGRSGGCSSAQTEGIGRLISLALQNNISLEDICKQLRGISCDKPIGFGRNKIYSCVDAISKGLGRLLKIEIEDSHDSSRTCPECGAILIKEGKCDACYSCGYKSCS